MRIPRLQLFEFEDLPRFPSLWRDLLTEQLAFNLETCEIYAYAVELLADSLRRSQRTHITDLCSGSGATSLWVFERVRGHLESELTVSLTDKFPNQEAAARIEQLPGYDYAREPVDALAIPAHLDGFRTSFTAFHHFPPDAARAVLRDAVRSRAPIAMFEITARKALPLLLTLLLPLVVLINALRMPLSAKRILWTFVLPVIPLVLTWDGLVSGLRSYEPDELEAMAARVDPRDTYTWTIGRGPFERGFAVTYLIGLPRARGPGEPN